jgi:hypothetical protein
MSISFTKGNHREWAASVIEDWHDAQLDMLKGKLSKDERKGIKSGVERTDELIGKLRNNKAELTHDEWDDAMMYVWQERCD